MIDAWKESRVYPESLSCKYLVNCNGQLALRVEYTERQNKVQYFILSLGRCSFGGLGWCSCRVCVSVSGVLFSVCVCLT